MHLNQAILVCRLAKSVQKMGNIHVTGVLLYSGKTSTSSCAGHLLDIVNIGTCSEYTGHKSFNHVCIQPRFFSCRFYELPNCQLPPPRTL